PSVPPLRLSLVTAARGDVADAVGVRQIVPLGRGAARLSTLRAHSVRGPRRAEARPPRARRDAGRGYGPLPAEACGGIDGVAESRVRPAARGARRREPHVRRARWVEP